MRTKAFALAVASLMLVSAPALAKHGHGKDRCYLETRDVRVISDYYAPRVRRLPPGLAKKYARTGRLPPGWQKKMEPLPIVVERQLVVLPPDYRRGVIDGYVVVYNPRTQIIVDIAAVLGR